MPTIEELTSWSIGEIQAAIASELPDNETFECSQGSEGWWEVVHFRLNPETGEESIIWEGSFLDQRIALYELYVGRIMLKDATPGSNPLWRTGRRSIDRFQKTHVNLGGSEDEDPEDLDPGVVQSFHAEGK